MRVSVFITCFNDTLFPQTGRAMVELFERLGHEVEFRPEQTCCGQMHMNSGYRDEGLELAARMRRVFDGAEAIVTPSASCAGHVLEHVPGLPVHELSQFLTGVLGVEDVGARYPARVAYHPTCHSLRALRVGDGPGRLLAAVEDLDLVEIGEADQCCGFGGTFAVKNAEVSMAMLEDKLSAIERSGAEAVTAVDNSCLMQIGGGLSRRGSTVRTLHLAEILAAT
jgi:L-lactate dehydrogenase complex protein LldE